ncbi:MAG: hypothetical protein CL931_07695 [Deltaproteobacteria bacterium]|nr:hypothetical protein [Deltaproteobacteria bacterium]
MSQETPEIDVVLTTLTLERVESDVAVAGFFTDERPLRGGAARADWRLCGGLSRRIESGDLSGRSGEAMLIACGRALFSPRLMLLGLGDRADYDRLRVSDEFRLALERCRKLRVPRVAISPLGIEPDDIPRHAAAVVAGIVGAWSKVTDPMRLTLCVPRSEVAGVYRAFESACDAAGETGIRLSTDESSLEAR